MSAMKNRMYLTKSLFQSSIECSRKLIYFFACGMEKNTTKLHYWETAFCEMYKKFEEVNWGFGDQNLQEKIWKKYIKY